METQTHETTPILLAVRSFRINVAQEALVDLRRRGQLDPPVRTETPRRQREHPVVVMRVEEDLSLIHI